MGRMCGEKLLISLTIKDSKTFFRPDSESKNNDKESIDKGSLWKNH